ncbi:MAG: GH25 family lysozyme [Pseudomonadota bacterium]
MRAFLCLCFAFALAACGGGGGDNRSATPVTSVQSPAPQFVSGNPKYADSDPVVWQGPKPWDYAVHGVDVARYQAGLDFGKLERNGIKFAFIKATEGGDIVDPEYKTHWARAKAAGVKRGAYHFYYWCRGPEDQAKWFIRNVAKEPSMLPPVLDVEWNHLSPTCKTRPPAAEVRAAMKTWLEMVKAHYGRTPIIYTTPDFYKRNEIWKINGYHMWLRAVARPLSEIYPGERWTFWQYSGTGRVPGAPGDIDLNVFRGSEATWNAWVARN